MLQDFSKYSNQYGGGYATKISLIDEFVDEANLIRYQNKN
jgi:hypothetical protein